MLEALASGSAIAREAKALLLKEGQGGSGRTGLLWEMTGGDPERLTAKEVGKAAAQGDPLALSVLEKAFRYLGIALGNLVNLLNPEIIVIGGGVAAMGPLLFRPAIQAMEATAFAHMCRDLPVVPALLGGEAGTRGMVALACRKIRVKDKHRATLFRLFGKHRCQTGLAFGHHRRMAGEEHPAALEQAVADHFSHLHYTVKPGILQNEVVHETADIHYSHHM